MRAIVFDAVPVADVPDQDDLLTTIRRNLDALVMDRLFERATTEAVREGVRYSNNVHPSDRRGRLWAY